MRNYLADEKVSTLAKAEKTRKRYKTKTKDEKSE